MRFPFLLFALLAITVQADPRRHAAQNIGSSVNRVMRSILQATDPTDVPTPDDTPIFPVTVAPDAPTMTPPPNDIPTNTPTDVPSDAPSDAPTDAPTDVPSDAPTDVPSDAPTDVPSDAPTDAPSDTPTEVPTDTPTEVPTDPPIDTATEAPTDAPIGNAPTLNIACNNTAHATRSLIAACWNNAFVSGIIDPTSPSFNTTNLEQFCNSTCVLNTLPNLKTSVENDCGSYLDEYGVDLINTPDRNYLAQLDVMLNVFCFVEGSKLTIDGIILPMNMSNISSNTTINYCYGRLPLLLNTSMDIFAQNSTVNYTNLNRVCATGCEDFGDVISLYADPTILALLNVTSTVCLKESGSRAEMSHQGYCVPYALATAQQLEHFPDNNASDAMITSYLDNTCDICMRSFFQRQISLAAVSGGDASTSQQAIKLLGAFCQQWGSQNTYCLITEYQNYNLIQSVTSPQACGSIPNFQTTGPLVTTTCPATCKEAMMNVSNVIGCCFPSFLSLITFESTNPQIVNNWISFITNNDTGCNVPIATQCSEQFYDVIFDVYNIDSTKFNTNTTAKQAAATDVAVSLGLLTKDVDPNIIVSTPPTTSPAVAFAGIQSTPKVTITARVRPPSNRQANRTQTILNSLPQVILTQLNHIPSIRADALKPTLANSSSLSYNILANTVVLPQAINTTFPTGTPIGPTDVPGGTTAPPGGTTSPPSATTSPPGGTTSPPSGTTAPPSGTTAPPSGTTSPPSGTTAPPSDTTSPPSGTTSPPTISSSTGPNNPNNIASNNSPLALLIAIVICVSTMLL